MCSEQGSRGRIELTWFPYYLHTDHLMTPRFATDASSEVVWRWKVGSDESFYIE